MRFCCACVRADADLDGVVTNCFTGVRVCSLWLLHAWPLVQPLSLHATAQGPLLSFLCSDTLHLWPAHYT
jgi:hypothetical protein